MSEYKTYIVEYISGFVVKRISSKLTCNHYKNCQFIVNQPNQPKDSNLITIQDCGNFLTHPSDFVKKVVELLEKKIF